MKKLLVLIVSFFVIGTNIAQVTTNGGSGLAPVYPSLAVAIAALNGVTITSPVVITLNGNETAPVGGYAITQLGGTALNPITIQGASSTITAATQAAGTQNDAIFKIIGGDWITIQNFTMTENPANGVFAIATNDMTEFGVALYPFSTTDGAQNNTIQNNTIILNFNYPNSIGIFSTSSSTSAHVNQDATSSAGTNSFNKFYGNFINDVAYGIYMISPPITATVFETGNDIGGFAPVTGNTIQFGCAVQATFTNVNRFSAVLPAGIYFRNCGAGNNASFNIISSLALAYVQTNGIGGIVTTIGTAATGVTYTSNVNSNGITLTNTGTTAITGIDFGYGISTGTIVGNNNEITLNQNNTAAVSAALIGIKANYTSATNSLIGNWVTVNQNPTVTGAVTSAVTGINAAGVGTTVTVNNNTITFKQALPGGTASFGSGAITYINVAAGSGTINLNSNQLLTTGSTIRSTGTLIGINHDATFTVGITINLNTMNIDRVATSGTVYGTYETGTPSGVNPTITNNNITFTNLAGTTAATVIQSNGGPTGLTSKTINNNTISTSGSNSGTVIGISVQYSNNSTINNNNITVSSAGPSITGIQATSSTSSHTLTGNSFSLTSSTTSPTSMTAINVGGTGPFQIYSNTFTAMNFTAITTASATISGIAVAAGSGNNIYNNDITNISVGAVTSTGSPVIRGIAITGGTLTNVYKNKIYGVTTAASGNLTTVSGITISGGTTNNVYNNLIGDLTAPAAVVSTAANSAVIGINITSTTSSSTQKIYYNTIYLNASSAGANFGTSGIFHQTSTTATTSTLDLRNNIIVNNSAANGTGLTVAYRRSNTTLTNYASTSNNNDFYAPILFSDGTNNDLLLSTYQTRVTPRDAASFTENPTFLSTTGSNANFLHINTGVGTAIESGGSNIAGITDDYDGNVRQGNPGYPPQVNGGGSAPDIGADEFDGTLIPIPKSLQSITYNQASTAFTYAGANDVEILRLDFAVTGNSGTLNLNSIVVNSLNTSDADVSAVKLYRTATTTFSTANPLGTSTNFSGGNATFSSLSYDLPTGTTYIWVAYDVAGSATYDDLLDAQIQANQIDVAGNTYPASDQSPSGNRQIKIGPITSFPFTENFEGGNFNNWFVVNGAQTNQWSVGTAINNGGSYAAYISNDGGTSNAYTITSASVVHFYRDVTFPGSGEFHIAFNWKGVGETTLYDYLRVFLIDPSTTPVEGTQLSSGQIGSDYYNQSAWQSVDLTVAPGNLGTTKRLVFSWRNDGSLGTQPPAALDNIQIYQAANMAYSSSTTTQNTSNTFLGATDQQVIGIQVVTTGAVSPLSITKFRVNANGSSSVSDISNAKIYYTGTSSTFAATNLFATVGTISDFNDFDMTGSQTLAQGTNYFWLTFDISGSATDGNLVDAECTQITVAGTDYTPTVTAPSGARTIRGPMSGNYNVGLTPFNKAAGTNLYTQRFTRMVERKVYEQPQITNKQKVIENLLTVKSIEEMECSNLPYRTEMVEEEYYVLMENGQPYSGSLSVKNSANSPEGVESSETFATITEAIANLNLRGVSGWVQFNLKDAAYNAGTGETFPIVINDFAGASSSNTVTIKPASGVSPTITGSTSSAVIALNGCDYVIIDGSNQSSGSSKDLTIYNSYTGGTFNFAVGLYHNGTKGATNSTIKNCILRGTPTVTNNYGLFLNAAGGGYHNTSAINNTIKNAKIGIQFGGVSGNVENNGLISGNIIGDASEPLKQGGIIAGYVDNLVISGNEIFGEAAGNSNFNQYGVLLLAGSTNSKIRKNNIHDFYYNSTTGYGCFGIYYNSDATTITEISNNMVSNIMADGDQNSYSNANYVPSGIYVKTGGNLQVYHNTVFMVGNTLGKGTSYDGMSSCLSIESGVTLLDVRNNIFMNSMGSYPGSTRTNKTYGVLSFSPNTAFTTIDYNDYYVNGVNPNVGYIGALDRSNLAAWQGASGQDVNSKEVAVNFVGAPDLHLAGASIGDVNLLGADLTGFVADDIDGDARLAPPMGPYMGADEGSMPLPVELSAFNIKVRMNAVQLIWTTKTETNSAVFEVQRSKDNHEWLNVGMVQAAGNSNSPKEYSFTDSKLQSGKYSYRLKMVDADGRYTFSNVVEAEVELPTEYAISQNYPNPFNPTTRIDYQLPFDSRVTLELYGITGEKIATLINTDLSAGYYTADVNASTLNLASGIYIYRMVASGGNNQSFTQVKKLMLTK